MILNYIYHVNFEDQAGNLSKKISSYLLIANLKNTLWLLPSVEHQDLALHFDHSRFAYDKICKHQGYMC